MSMNHNVTNHTNLSKQMKQLKRKTKSCNTYQSLKCGEAASCASKLILWILLGLEALTCASTVILWSVLGLEAANLCQRSGSVDSARSGSRKPVPALCLKVPEAANLCQHSVFNAWGHQTCASTVL